VTPDESNELDKLRAKVEQLRVTNADFRFMIDGLETAAHDERAAVVAWLRVEVDAAMGMQMPVRALTFLKCADEIERGDHRRVVKVTS